MKFVDGQLFLKMVQNAARALLLEKDKLNRMNVFPVPDGDTGINMYATVSSTFNIKSESTNIGEISQLISDAMLRSSRGNSGTILATFFIGIAKYHENFEKVSVKDMINGFNMGQKSSYSMIMSPQEGTILTVMKEVGKIDSSKFSDFEDLFKFILDKAEETTKKTPELLPVLKSAGVVDSGAYGFLVMLRGMYKALLGEMIEVNDDGDNNAANFDDFDNDDYDFSFCCEGVIEKFDEYRGFDKCSELKSLIASLGNSEVFVETNKIIKFHIHVNSPERVMEYASKYGNIASWKVDNMMDQLNEMKGKERIKYALIPVVIGDGFESIFMDSGATAVIDGVNTLNVSFAQIADVIKEVNAETIFLFPNNKDTIATCELVKKTLTDQNIIVIKTISMVQSLVLISNFNENKTPEECELRMIKKLDKIAPFAITNAAKDSKVGNLVIHKDDYMAILNGKIIDSFADEIDTFKYVAGLLLSYSVVSLYYGADISEDEANEKAEVMKSILGDDIDVLVLYGGQTIYRYLILGE